MFKFLNIHRIIILFFCIISFSSNAFAIECYDESPHLISLEDEYFLIKENKRLSSKENDFLNDLYKDIEGEWQGTIVYTDCSGTKRSPKEKYREAIASVKVSSIEYFIFSLDLLFKKQNTVKHTTFQLLSDVGIIGFYFLDKNNLEYSKLQSVSIIGGGSNIIETNFKINRNDNSLLIEVSYFIKGSYTGNEIWSFTRD